MAAPTAIEPDQYPKAANEERQHLEQIHSVLALLPIKPLNLITAEVQRHLAAVRLVFLDRFGDVFGPYSGLTLARIMCVA
jgi:hypothetical protein